LIDVAQNVYLKKMINNMHILMHAFHLSRQLTPQADVPTQYTHEEIVQALRKDDLALATQLMRNHIAITKDELLELARKRK